MPAKKKRDDYFEVEVIGKKHQDPTVVTRISRETPPQKKGEDKDIDTKIKELKDLTEKIKIEKDHGTREKESSETKVEDIKKVGFVGDVLKTSVDRLYDLVKLKGIIRVRTASKILGIKFDTIEEWARVLEDRKMIKLHYPSFGEPVMILRRFRKEVKGGKKVEKAVKKKPRKAAFAINLIILSVFIIAIALIFGGFTLPVDDPFIYVYAISGLIIVVAVIFIIRAFVKFRRNKKETPKKTEKKDEKEGKREDKKGDKKEKVEERKEQGKEKKK